MFPNHTATAISIGARIGVAFAVFAAGADAARASIAVVTSSQTESVAGAYVGTTSLSLADGKIEHAGSGARREFQHRERQLNNLLNPLSSLVANHAGGFGSGSMTPSSNMGGGMNANVSPAASVQDDASPPARVVDTGFLHLPPKPYDERVKPPQG